MAPEICITLLYGLSGVLPLIGFYRLLRSTRRWKREAARIARERGHDRLTQEDLDPGEIRLTDLPSYALNQVGWDIALVGGGVVLAAIASIWSVWL